LFTLVRGRGILRTSPSRSSAKYVPQPKALPNGASLFALFFVHLKGHSREGQCQGYMSRLEQKLNNPRVVLVVGVIAVALNALLYFGIFLPRMTPLIAQINPVGTSLLEAISKSVPQAGSEPQAGSKPEAAPQAGSNPRAGSESGPEAGSNPEEGTQAGPYSSGNSGPETRAKSGPEGSVASQTASPQDSPSGSPPNSPPQSSAPQDSPSGAPPNSLQGSPSGSPPQSSPPPQ
jgi:hypothetical protein